MKLLGFKKSRLSQWLNVVDLAIGGLTTWGRIRVIWGMAWAVLVGRMAQRRVWRNRIRTCGRCPFYDMPWKKCGRNFNEGCGCYVPFAALFKKQCWAREKFPEKDLGW